MFRPEIAFIMRSDEMIKEYNLKRITVDTLIWFSRQMLCWKCKWY